MASQSTERILKKASGGGGTKKLKIGQYVLGETLGHGSFGKVKMAKHNITQHMVAVKILNRQKIKSLDVAEKIRREIQILKMFRHPHIIKLYEVITTPTDIFMIMEYVSGGELFDYIVKKGKSTEPEARRFFQQMISGVHYCHRHKVVHRDLKPENLLLDSNNHVKIADFGLSNLMKDGEFLSTSCGSPNYAAPEVVSGKLYAGPEVDVWSCGIILYALLCGSLPFDDRNVQVLFKKIKSGHFYIPPQLSTQVVDLLTKMLQVNPVKRITIEGICAHEWFKEDLPNYLFPLSEAKFDEIDSSVLAEVCQKLSVSPSDVLAALRGDDQHAQLAVAYHLVLDNRAMLKISAGELPQSVAPELPISPSFTTEGVPVPQQSSVQQPQSSYTRSISSRSTRTLKRPKWHLGIRSQSRPQDIMAEIFRKLKAHEFEWKIISPYYIRCRYIHPMSGLVVKLDLQLYQIDQRNYLLDFKCVNPSLTDAETNQSDPSIRSDEKKSDVHPRHFAMEFFEICSRLISSLAQ